MPTSDKELENKVQRNEKLRQQLAKAVADREAAEREVANDVTAANLDAEAARLEVQLEEAKRLKQLSRSKDPNVGASTPLASAEAEMRAAQEQQKALADANKKEN